MENQFLSDLVSQFLVAMVPVAIGALAYLGKQLISWIKSKTSAEQYALLQSLAVQAVKAAEQTMKSKPGQEKKAAALAVVRSALLSRGIKIDESAVSAAIEAAVYAEVGVTVAEDK